MNWRKNSVLIVLLSLSNMQAVEAAITALGDIDPTYTGFDPWSVVGDLTVGWDTVGSITLGSGSRINSNNAFLGYDFFGDGTATLSGVGTRWDNTAEFWVAGSGLGDLFINQGALLSSDDVLIGVELDGEGRVAVSDNGSWLQAIDELQVGYTGTGVLLVERGATVSSAYGTIGAYPGSSGIAQVIDTDSLWTNSGTLYVGGDQYGVGGSGILDVSDGGIVQASDLIIWANGEVEGNGFIQATTISNEGVLDPVGTLTIQGDLAMEQGSVLDVDLDNSGASDLVDVFGDIDLYGGNVVARSGETITQQWDYLVMQGDVVAGDLSSIDRSQVDIDLSESGIPDIWFGYTSDAVYLSVVALPFDDPEVTQSANQRALGSALQGISDRGGNNITDALGDLNGFDRVRSAYDQLSGQNRALVPSMALGVTDGFTQDLSGHLTQQATGWSPPSVRSQRSVMGAWQQESDPHGGAIWGSLYGLGGRRKSDAELPGYRFMGGGAAFGFDTWLTDLFLVGVAGGGSVSRADHDAGDDVTDIEALHTGLYSRLKLNTWRLDSTVTYHDLDFKTRRDVELVGERLEGRFGGRALGATVEGAWLWHESMDWDIEPLVGAHFTRLHVDGYQETGGTSALRFSDQDSDSIRSSLGLRLAGPISSPGSGTIKGVFHGRWLHEFGDERPGVVAHFVNDSLSRFSVTDRDIGRDSFAAGFSVEAEISRQTQIVFHYQGLFNSDLNHHVLSGGLQYRW